MPTIRTYIVELDIRQGRNQKFPTLDEMADFVQGQLTKDDKSGDPYYVTDVTVIGSRVQPAVGTARKETK